MVNTALINLPLMTESQGSKYLTYNESLAILDAIVQCAAIDRTNTPPGSPADGDVYLLSTTPTGVWSGKANHIAYYDDSTWHFITPREGMNVWVKDEDISYIYSGSAWGSLVSLLSFQNIPLLGVNTTADSTNKLAVASDAVLFNHNGTSSQIKVNKAAAGNTASHLFQTGFSGRAEMGTMGDDHFRFKTSPDGASFFTALYASKDDGGVDTLSTISDVASAATCNIGAALTQRVRITGTTTITSFGSTINKMRFVRFAGVLTLTHNGTTLILPGGANIVTAADDTCIAVSDSSGNWRVIQYTRATGKGLIPTTLYASLSVGSRETNKKLFVESGDISFGKVAVESGSYASKSLNVSTEELSVSGVYLSPDGKRMYIQGSASDNVREYILSTAFDVSTGTLNASFPVNTEDTSSNGITFKPDGTKFWMIGTTNDRVYAYTMATPWQISTATYDSVSFLVSTQETVPSDVDFKPDGTKMYIVGSNSDAIQEYNLSTAWDISTASHVQSFSIAGQETTPQDMHISGDGLRIFILGDVGNDVTIYQLSTAWDISTCVYLTEFSVVSQDTNPAGLFIKSDGSTMYIGGQNTDTVYQYTLPISVYDIIGALNVYGDLNVRNNLTVRGKTDLGQEITANKRVIPAGTTGAAVIHTPIGAVNFAAAAASLVVTNSYCTVNSIILATVATNDTTMLSVKAVAGAGSFTLYAGAAPTAETRVNFLIIN